MQDPSATGGIDGLLLMAAGLGGGGLLGGGLWLMRRRPPEPEPQIRRGPSPASLGLDDDPIVAALVRRSDAARRDRGLVLPDDQKPLT
jgi:hypothetical protein